MALKKSPSRHLETLFSRRLPSEVAPAFASCFSRLTSTSFLWRLDSTIGESSHYDMLPQRHPFFHKLCDDIKYRVERNAKNIQRLDRAGATITFRKLCKWFVGLLYIPVRSLGNKISSGFRAFYSSFSLGSYRMNWLCQIFGRNEWERLGLLVTNKINS